MNFLEQIKKEIELPKAKENFLTRKEKPLSLSLHLKRGNGIIGEFKRATPTRTFMVCRSPEDFARLYEINGFSAVSVVVQENYFLTTAEDLKKIKNTVSIPVIQKGFILSESQLIEARNNGADSVLLIVTLTGKKVLSTLLDKCQELQLEPIVEVHSEKDVEEISDLPVKIVGVNNRDLSTLKVDLSRGESILALLKKENIGELRIIESGLTKAEDLRRFRQAGADGFLIGSCFMEAEKVENKIMELIGGLNL